MVYEFKSWHILTGFPSLLCIASFCAKQIPPRKLLSLIASRVESYASNEKSRQVPCRMNRTCINSLSYTLKPIISMGIHSLWFSVDHAQRVSFHAHQNCWIYNQHIIHALQFFVLMPQGSVTVLSASQWTYFSCLAQIISYCSATIQRYEKSLAASFQSLQSNSDKWEAGSTERKT